MTAAGARRIARVAGTGLPLRGNDIDTDRIIPARFLRAVTFEGLGDHVFEDDRAQDPAHPFSNPAFAGAAVLIVNENFGCGSSREHAPRALRLRGIRALVGESYSEIFFGNALALGVPCLGAAPRAVAQLMARVEATPSLHLVIDLPALTVQADDLVIRATLPDAARHALLNGHWDATGLLLEHFEDVQAVAAALPYVNGWR